MGTLIRPTTDAVTSNPFVVQRNERVGIKASGLATDETATIQCFDSSTGQFVPLLDNGIMTATAYQITIQASGTYRVVKTATAGAAGVSYD